MTVQKTTKQLQDAAKKKHLKADTRSKTTKRSGAGRPKIVTEELLGKVIERMCEGESLINICRDPSMPSRGTVLNYAMMRRDAKEDWVQRFSAAYEIAKQIRAESYAEEIVDIADSSSAEETGKARLQIDARKWLASKLINQYSDRSKHEITGAEGGAIKTESSVVFYLPENNRNDKSLEKGIDDDKD